MNFGFYFSWGPSGIKCGRLVGEPEPQPPFVIKADSLFDPGTVTHLCGKVGTSFKFSEWKTETIPFRASIEKHHRQDADSSVKINASPGSDKACKP